MSDDTATEGLAKSHLDAAKALEHETNCDAFPKVVVVLEDCVTHTLQARRDARDTKATVVELKKYCEEELPDKIIEKANGNADRIEMGFNGKTLSGKSSTILRFVAVLVLIFIGTMVGMTWLEDRGLIDTGSQKMVESTVAKAVADAMGAKAETPN